MTVFDLLSKLDNTIIHRVIFSFINKDTPDTLDGPYEIAYVLEDRSFTDERISEVVRWNISPMLYDTPVLIRLHKMGVNDNDSI